MDIHILQEALGIVSPWFIERTEFDAQSGRLDIHINFVRGSVFSVEGSDDQAPEQAKVYDTRQKTWRKFALDSWQGMTEHIDTEVVPIIEDFSVDDLDNLLTKSKIGTSSLDTVFTSNLFEHLSHKQIESTLHVLKSSLNMYLKFQGKLIIMQPNYRYCYCRPKLF